MFCVAAAVNEKHLSGRLKKLVTPNLGSLGSFIATFYMGGGAQQWSLSAVTSYQPKIQN